MTESNLTNASETKHEFSARSFPNLNEIEPEEKIEFSRGNRKQLNECE